MKFQFQIFLYIFSSFIVACSSNNEYQLDESTNALIEAETIDSSVNAQSIYGKYDSKLVDDALDTIWFSKKVQDLDREIRKISSDERFLEMMMQIDDDEINVKLSEDNGDNLVTHLSFIITPENQWKIYFYDPIEDLRIDFKEWVLD